MRIAKAKEVLLKLIPKGEPLLFTGPPGIGKTSLVKQVAKELDFDLMILHPILDDRVDYKGLPAVVDGKAAFLPFGNLETLIEATKPLVVFLDDLGQSPQDVQAAIMQLVLGRELNGKKISDDVVFVAASNRKEDKAGVHGLLAPLLDRFIGVYDIEFNIDDFAAWMMQQQYDPSLVGFARFRTDLIGNSKASGKMEKIPTPRSIAGVGELLLLNLADQEILAGAVGEAFAVEYLAFREVVSTIPDVKTIWKRPSKVKVPKDSATLYALMSALAFHVKPENTDALLTYLNRCPPEFAVVAFKDTCSRDEMSAMQINPEFMKWVTDNSAVFDI